MWTFMIFLGLFLGPTLSGFSVEKYGFRASKTLPGRAQNAWKSSPERPKTPPNR